MDGGVADTARANTTPVLTHAVNRRSLGEERAPVWHLRQATPPSIAIVALVLGGPERLRVGLSSSSMASRARDAARARPSEYRCRHGSPAARSAPHGVRGRVYCAPGVPSAASTGRGSATGQRAVPDPGRLHQTAFTSARTRDARCSFYRSVFFPAPGRVPVLF